MNHDKLLETISSNNIIIPLYIYKIYPKLKIDSDTFIFLMYLYSKGNRISFDVNELSKEFYTDSKKIMQYIANLQNNKLIEIKVIKNDKNIMEEYIFLDSFYEKITMSIINEEKNDNDKDESDEIFELLEKEVGLQLSIVEVEIVKQWKYDKDVIKEAIKEAVNNNVANIRYIDKVLYNWSKKGYKTVKDIENNRKSFREKDKKEEKVNVFDYDWLDNDE